MQRFQFQKGRQLLICSLVVCVTHRLANASENWTLDIDCSMFAFLGLWLSG